MKRKHQTGFSLLELIVVLIIIGVLAVSLLPRFFDATGTSEYVYQDEVANLLRLQQMQAMQCTRCAVSNIAVSATSILAAGASCADDSSQALCPAARDNIRFSASHSPLGFDSLGRPVGCGGACQISIQGSNTLRICIESEGYIHPC
jgi:MSHA pilin protein MshC